MPTFVAPESVSGAVVAAGSGAAGGSRVAERVAWFYATHPRGRIITDLVTRAREAAVFRAAVFRDAADALPAATGWSAGNPAGGAALERVEEAAVGRALANLGFAVAPRRGAGVARPRLASPAEASPEVRQEAPNDTSADTPPPLADEDVPWPGARVGDDSGVDPERLMLVADLAALVARAERYGLRARRAAHWCARLRAGVDAPEVLREGEQRLRAWIDRRRGEPYAGAV
jgi:hypothetical protein